MLGEVAVVAVANIHCLLVVGNGGKDSEAEGIGAVKSVEEEKRGFPSRVAVLVTESRF